MRQWLGIRLFGGGSVEFRKFFDGFFVIGINVDRDIWT